MNGDQTPRNSGTFRTMTEKATDSTWKRWTLFAGTIAATLTVVKLAAPVVAPLLGIVVEQDLKWRTDKILFLEKDIAAKEARIAVLEHDAVNRREEIKELKSDIRELRAR